MPHRCSTKNTLTLDVLDCGGGGSGVGLRRVDADIASPGGGAGPDAASPEVFLGGALLAGCRGDCGGRGGGGVAWLVD